MSIIYHVVYIQIRLLFCVKIQIQAIWTNKLFTISGKKYQIHTINFLLRFIVIYNVIICNLNPWVSNIWLCLKIHIFQHNGMFYSKLPRTPILVNCYWKQKTHQKICFYIQITGLIYCLWICQLDHYRQKLTLKCHKE